MKRKIILYNPKLKERAKELHKNMSLSEYHSGMNSSKSKLEAMTLTGTHPNPSQEGTDSVTMMRPVTNAHLEKEGGC